MTTHKHQPEESEKIQTIEMVKPTTDWTHLFEIEKIVIEETFGDNLVDIFHIGSTAIPGIYTKPIIDILPVVKDIEAIDTCNERMIALGYKPMGEYGMPGRRYFWRSPHKRSHHIHTFQKGSPEISRHIRFRDYIINHPDEAKAYSNLKRQLARKHRHDIQSYMHGKNDFIQRIDQLAAKEEET